MSDLRIFVQAKNYTKASRTKVDLLVIHSMEAPEKGATAENCAAYFAGTQAPQASAHYCIDSDSIVQCVQEQDVAWHAPGANRTGIGLEHAGYARQTEQEWLDLYSVAMLLRSAELAAEICLRWNIPILRLTVEELKVPGARGICGHDDCTKAFSGGKGHTDPGPHFPWDWYIERILEAAERIQEASPPTLPPPSQADLFSPVGIQSALQVLGFEVGTIDGVIGPKTKKAIIYFQLRHDLVGDGIVGPKTRDALEKALKIQRIFTSQ